MEIMKPEMLAMNNAVDFRAPPPSPVASSRLSCFNNEDVLTDFIQHSLKVPDLILPDKVFPRQKSIQAAPKLDFKDLGSVEDILGSVAELGSLEVINHGISRDLIQVVMDLGDGLFGIPPEKKRAVVMSPERPYGFEETDGDDHEIKGREEFLWCGEETLSLEMEAIWPNGYSNFRKHMEILSDQIEEVAAKTLRFLQHNTLKDIGHKNDHEQETIPRKSCYIHKHKRNMGSIDTREQWLSYDVIKMLIKGSESPHALCLHVCNGSTDFHVYSKKGWVSFCPNQDSLVITIGDKLQVRAEKVNSGWGWMALITICTKKSSKIKKSNHSSCIDDVECITGPNHKGWSGGQYKHVVGRAVLKGGDEEKCVSMSFLYSPSPNLIFQDHKISVAQQAMFALLLTLACQFFVFVLFK